MGGDIDKPVGPFEDSLALMRSDILQRCGITDISVAGYPEGHPRISDQILWRSMAERIRFAEDNSLGISVLTQFSFTPSRVTWFCDRMAHESPDVPLYIGMAGPTDSLQLMRYARICGVSTTIRTLHKLGRTTAKLAMHTDPVSQLQALAHYCATHPSHNVTGVHLFSFGGFVRSTEWIHDAVNAHA
ncbi:MAG: methylenetetrahydrofolate reductase [Halieaceae bacterium]|nr:methylenetetrahydrofolate reductase [Halieaceae bacterium]